MSRHCDGWCTALIYYYSGQASAPVRARHACFRCDKQLLAASSRGMYSPAAGFSVNTRRTASACVFRQRSLSPRDVVKCLISFIYWLRDISALFVSLAYIRRVFAKLRCFSFSIFNNTCIGHIYYIRISRGAGLLIFELFF